MFTGIRRSLPLFAALFLAALSGHAFADSITYSAFTTGSPADGVTHPFSAEATFTASANQLVIVLTNDSPSTYSAGELFRSVVFSVSGVTTGTLTSSLGTSRTVIDDGTFTDGSSASQNTHWNLAGGPNFTLSADGSKYLVIGAPETGDGLYHGNGSINGNPGHTPFLKNSPTFTLTINGLTSVNQISHVSFGLGTGTDTVTTTVLEHHTTPVPLPASLWAGGSLLMGLGGLRILRRKA